MPSYYTFLQLRPSATEAICAIVLALFLASVFPPAGFRISHGPSCPPTRLPNVNPKHFALLRAPCHMPLFHDKPRKLVTNCPPLAPPFGLASVFLDAYIHVHAYGVPAMSSYHPKYHRQCLNDTYEYDGALWWGANGLFKWETWGGTVHLENVTIRMDMPHTRGWSPLVFRPTSDGNTYSNVTFVWQGNATTTNTRYLDNATVSTYSYDQLAELPDGVTYTEDVTVWDKAKARWIARNSWRFPNKP